jgi:uncharacterized protein YihD (DUF1040 family)
MRNPDRIKTILNKVGALWKKYPDLRLCQLLFNAAKMSGWEDNDLFDIEDEQLEKGIDSLEEIINNL